MPRVTRDVDPGRVRDLLERAPRACVAFAGDGGPVCLPAILIWREGRFLVGVLDDDLPRPAPGQEAVLLVDEGIQWFDLRAVYVRGRASPSDPPAGAPRHHRWFEIVADRTVAWDYGQLREERDGA
jgi:hypothetical protein